MDEKKSTQIGASARALIDADRKKSHVVFFVDVSTGDEDFVQAEIEEGLTDIRNRAQAADMMVLSTSISQSSHFMVDLVKPEKSEGRLCLTIICAWASRDDLEQAHRRQELAGGPVRRVS